MLTIIGSGAVGTTIAAYGLSAKIPLQLFARSKDYAAFLQTDGLRLERPQRPLLTVALPGLVGEIPSSPGSVLLLATKFSALPQIVAQIPAGGRGITIISALNGVQAVPYLRAALEHAQLVPLTVMFNAQLLSPLHARLTTRPKIILGEADASVSRYFKGSGLALSRARGEQTCWGKLLINLGNAIGALCNATFKDLLTEPHLRQLYAATLHEAVTLLHAANIAFKLPMPLPQAVYLGLLRHGGPLPWWLAVAANGLDEGAYPSMVADFNAQRLTEVDQLNGEIVALATQLGCTAPINARLQTLVQQRGQLVGPPLGAAELYALCL